MKQLLTVSSIILFSFSLAAQDKEIIVPPSTLIVQGIPPVPVSIKNDMMRYTESRTASFADWNPVKREMLISTRFGNVPQIHLVKMPLGARIQKTFFEEGITDATYDPVKGDYFLYVKDIGGNEFGQIYRYDLSSGSVTMLTDGGRSQNGGITWNHHGNLIAYGSTRRNGADRDIYIMNPKERSTDKILLTNSGGGWSVSDWSKDDKKLLVGEELSANESHLWLVDATTGEKTPVTDRNEKNVFYGEARFSKDGKGIYFTTDKDNEFARLSYMDLATKKIKFITTIPWDVDGFDLSEDGKHIAFTTNEAGESKLYLLTTATNQYTQVKGLLQGVYGIPAFHKNSKDVAFNINSSRSASDVYVLDITSGKLQRWTESEMGGLNPDQLVIPSLIRWKSFDRKEITGFYYKPPSKFPGKRPVVINIHGGPEGQSRPTFLGANNYYLNEMGIAIIYPNVRGSTGYGKSYLASDNGLKRDGTIKDIGALLDWIAKQPDLDADHVMVTGGSYGGYMTLAVATTYNDKIRCSLDVVGISNFNTFLKNTESYRRDLRRVEYGDERDPAMHDYFERTAPLNNVQKITKPLFIVLGTNDPRVPRTEAVQMSEKVKANGGELWYLEGKNEGHGFRKKDNADFQRYATVLFMRKYLLGM